MLYVRSLYYAILTIVLRLSGFSVDVPLVPGAWYCVLDQPLKVKRQHRPAPKATLTAFLTS